MDILVSIGDRVELMQDSDEYLTVGKLYTVIHVGDGFFDILDDRNKRSSWFNPLTQMEKGIEIRDNQ